MNLLVEAPGMTRDDRTNSASRFVLITLQALHIKASSRSFQIRITRPDQSCANDPQLPNGLGTENTIKAGVGEAFLSEREFLIDASDQLSACFSNLILSQPLNDGPFDRMTHVSLLAAVCVDYGLP